MASERSADAAIIVLGARLFPDGRTSGAVRRRIECAAKAFHDGMAPIVLCTGGYSWNGHVEALRMREELLKLRVNADAILVELVSTCTAQNAFFSTKMLRQRGIRTARVVTCPWHMRRALADFRLCGLEVTALPAEAAPMTLSQRLRCLAVERCCEWIDRVRLSV